MAHPSHHQQNRGAMLVHNEDRLARKSNVQFWDHREHLVSRKSFSESRVETSEFVEAEEHTFPAKHD